MSITAQDKIAIRKSSSNPVNATGEPGFDSLFEEFEASNGNTFYRIKADLIPDTSLFNGQLVRLSLPAPFLTPTGVPVGAGTVIPLLIYLDENGNGTHTHFCELSPKKTGTECSRLLQIDPTLYFKTLEPGQIQNVKNNAFFQEIVDKYKDKETLYYLPTQTAHNSIVYVVFDKKEDLDAVMTHKQISAQSYFIALNGFFIPIDAWNCTLLFHNDVTAGVKSEAVVRP